MNSFDITSFYTNIKKCHNFFATHKKKIKFNSPLPINTLIDIRKLITNMTYFRFNNVCVYVCVCVCVRNCWNQVRFSQNFHIDFILFLFWLLLENIYDFDKSNQILKKRRKKNPGRWRSFVWRHVTKLFQDTKGNSGFLHIFKQE